MPKIWVGRTTLNGEIKGEGQILFIEIDSAVLKYVKENFIAYFCATPCLCNMHFSTFISKFQRAMEKSKVFKKSERPYDTISPPAERVIARAEKLSSNIAQTVIWLPVKLTYFTTRKNRDFCKHLQSGVFDSFQDREK